MFNKGKLYKRRLKFNLMNKLFIGWLLRFLLLNKSLDVNGVSFIGICGKKISYLRILYFVKLLL